MTAWRVDHLLVVDVETTGLYNSDRVVEVAAVTLSAGGQIVDSTIIIGPWRTHVRLRDF